MKITSVLTKENKWTKNCLARDKDGKPMTSLDTFFLAKFDKDGNIYYQEFHQDELAASFSLQGAVIHCYPIDDHEHVMNKLSQAISSYSKKKLYVAQFNDHPDTTYEDVISVARMAQV